MTVYARSDLASITVSAAHGGCGKVHVRPAPGGNPVKLWSLTCPPCEDYLRNDGLWSSTISDIPETVDEKSAREDYETRGAKDRDYIQALALAKIAGVAIPESLTRVLSGAMAHIPGQLLCPDGHANPAGQKFCGECAKPLHGQPAEAQIEAPVSSAPKAAKRLRDMRAEDLRQLARERGIDDSGTRADLLERLRGTEAKAAA